MFASLGFGVNEVAEAANTGQVSVTLHKKKMIALPDPLIENTGSEMPIFNAYDNMPNVTFEVRDATDAFYVLRAGGMSAADAMAEVAINPGTDTVATGTTGADGKVNFHLDAIRSGKDAVYVFVETVAPAGTTKAANMALVLPLYNANDEKMTDILLYPKNIVKADGQVTITKKGTADDTVLPDAKFIVTRELTEANIEYLVSLDAGMGLWTWSTTRANAKEFVTNNLGQITIAGLEHGDYKLIEIAAPDNASIINDGVTGFKINDDTTILAFDVYNDTILIDKDRDNDIEDYNVGDLIPYTIKVNIPEGMGYQFPDDTYRHPSLIITDAPDVGLQYNGDLKLHVDGTEITIDPSWMDTAGNGFSITIPAAALAEFEGLDLTLTYNMFLDGKAAPDIGYDNLATVTTNELDDNDYGPEVFTGGHKFRKVDANFDTQNALAGAVFVVRDSDADDALYLNIGADNTVTWVADRNDATEYTSSADPDFLGEILVSGLEEGDYWLEEVEAPTDYVLREQRTKFTIVIGKYGETHLDIVNVRKGILPSTGGSGIIGIVSLGAVLIATTGGYYIKRRRDA